MIAKYNAWKGTTYNQSGASIIAVAKCDDSSYLKAAVATVKSEAETALNSAIEGAITSEQLSYAWRKNYNITDYDRNVGLATIANEEKDDELKLKNMWEKFQHWLTEANGTGMLAKYYVEEDDEVTYPYANADGSLILEYKLAIKSLINAKLAAN